MLGGEPEGHHLPLPVVAGAAPRHLRAEAATRGEVFSSPRRSSPAPSQISRAGRTGSVRAHARPRSSRGGSAAAPPCDHQARGQEAGRTQRRHRRRWHPRTGQRTMRHQAVDRALRDRRTAQKALHHRSLVRARALPDRPGKPPHPLPFASGHQTPGASKWNGPASLPRFVSGPEGPGPACHQAARPLRDTVGPSRKTAGA